MGSLSSWYLFSSMGFYPVTPCSNSYAIGSPTFDKVTIPLGQGKVFEIKAIHNSKMEAQVRLLEKRNEELTALIKQKLPHCLIGSMLLSSKDLELLGEVQELRNRCIRQNASALAQQQTQALRLDDLRHKLRALCKSNFLQSVAAVERWKDELQTTEHSGVVE